MPHNTTKQMPLRRESESTSAVDTPAFQQQGFTDRAASPPTTLAEINARAKAVLNDSSGPTVFTTKGSPEKTIMQM